MTIRLSYGTFVANYNVNDRPMKKITFALMALVLMSLVSYGQKKMIVPIASRSSTMGTFVKIGDFVWIDADSAMYRSKVALGPSATGTYLTADASRYAVAKIAAGRNALTATTLDVSGAATLGATLALTGNLAINTNKFTVAASSGNTVVAGTLGVTGNVAVNTNKFNVTAASGNTAIAGTLAVTGATTQTGKFTCADTIAAAVATTSGNASVGGALSVTGNVAVNTNKFTVTAASGNTVVAGTLGVTGNVAVNTNKFTVAASSGNTVVAGTLGVTGLATMSAGAVVTADTTTAVVGKIVYVAADSSFYGCRSTLAAKKWYKLN